MFVQNFVAIHHIVVEIFQSEPKQWTNHHGTSIATNITFVLSPEWGQMETVEHLLTEESSFHYTSGEIWLNWVGWWKSCCVAAR